MRDMRDLRSDAELLAAGPDDADAFAIFYRRHVGDVLALARRHARPDEAGDLVAEVFASALVHRRRFDPARGAAGAWLAGIARHKLADARRRGALDVRLTRRLGLHPPALAVDAEVDLEAPELLEGLPLDQRRAVEDRVLADKPYVQVAREHAVSEPTVRKRVSRALSTLRARMEESQQ